MLYCVFHLSAIVLFVGIATVSAYESCKDKLHYELNDADLGEEWCDFIVVGAGTGGLAVASRLAEVKEWSVCVVERGPQEDEADFKQWTCGWGKPKDFTNPHDPNCFSTPQLTVGRDRSSGRLIYTPRFEGAGGTSRIYGAIVRRPSPAILNNWPETWDLESMDPYYKTLEDHYCYHYPEEVTGISPEDCKRYHGEGGPMPVHTLNQSLFKGFSEDFSPICKDDSSPWGGYTTDYNGKTDKRLGCSVFQQFTHLVGSEAHYQTARASSFSGYLKNNFNPIGNLRIIFNAPVTKIAFEGTSAVGVYYVASNGEIRLLKATKEVIISAGAYETPHLLQVSGVGDPALLKSIGVDVVAINMEVGQNLWDHISVPYVMELKAPDPARGIYTSNGPFSWIIHMDSEHRPANEAISDLQLYFMDNSPMFSATDVVCHPDPPGGVDPSLQTQIRIIHQYPSYRGQVNATSKSIFTKPLIDPKWTFPIPEADLAPFVKIIQFFREKMKGDSAWANLIKQEILPGVVPGESDSETIAKYLQHAMVSALHPACTCAMGKCSNERLQVLNTENLRVCDASAFATQVDGNPAVTIFAMAEKLAVLLKEEYLHSEKELGYITTVWQQEMTLSAAQVYTSFGQWNDENSVWTGLPSANGMNVVWELVSHDDAAMTYSAKLTAPSARSLGVESLTLTSSVIVDKARVSLRYTANVVLVSPQSHVGFDKTADRVMSLLTEEFQQRFKSDFGFSMHLDLPLFVNAIVKPSEMPSTGPRAGSLGRPIVYVLWREDFSTITPEELWRSAGAWYGTLNGKRSTAVGSMNHFRLPGLPEMFEFIIRYVDGLDLVYHMNRTEPPGQPGYDYVGTKRVIPYGPRGSSWMRSASLTCDENVDALTAGIAILNDVFVSGSRRLGWKPAAKGSVLVYKPLNLPRITNRLAAFDLDGTIIVTKSGGPFAKNVSDWKFLNSNVVSKLRELFDSGMTVAIISNQGRGNDTTYLETWKAKLHSILAAIDRPILVIAALKYDEYRKPKTSMWTYLLNQSSSIQATFDSFYSGDAAGRPKDFSDSDKVFAANVNTTFYTPEEIFSSGQNHVVTEAVTLTASADDIWAVVGDFFGLQYWHPSISETYLYAGGSAVRSEGSSGLRRYVHFPVGNSTTIEELIDTQPYSYSYKWYSGEWGELFQNYYSRISVSPTSSGGSVVEWYGSFTNPNPSAVVEFYRAGLDALKRRENRDIETLTPSPTPVESCDASDEGPVYATISTHGTMKAMMMMEALPRRSTCDTHPKCCCADDLCPVEGSDNYIELVGGGSAQYKYERHGEKNVVVSATAQVTPADLDHGTSTNQCTRDYVRSLQDHSFDNPCDAGHILANRLGGLAVPKNLFCQDPNINRQPYRLFEAKIYKCLKSEGATVGNLSWKFEYEHKNDHMPISVTYSATFEGGDECSTLTDTFTN